MDNSDRITGIVATVFGFALGLLAAIFVVFIGVNSWSIRTTVYAAAAAAFLVGAPVYYLAHYYLKNRGPRDE